MDATTAVATARVRFIGRSVVTESCAREHSSQVESRLVEIEEVQTTAAVAAKEHKTLSKRQVSRTIALHCWALLWVGENRNSGVSR